MNRINNWLQRWLKPGRARLADETDSVFTLGARMAFGQERDRPAADREEILREALEAWRVNPLARRMVGLTTQYVVGGGLQVSCEHPATHAFLEEWWNHRLNQLGMRVYEWCDELARAGELFLLLSTDAAGMTYVRAVPAAAVEQVDCAENDVQQETGFHLRPSGDQVEGRVWPAYCAEHDFQQEDGGFTPVMLHYAVNRPVGAVHGESDLAPLLRWLSRYSAWLEDRARLNRYRNAFLFVVKGRWESELARKTRQDTLALTPPSPGSILVTDESESWEVLNPRLESSDANEDGLALKKMIAAGCGLPLHFLAEPEGSNRSTAESAGGPTYRHFEQRQEFFCWLITDLAKVVVRRRGLVNRRVKADARVAVHGADLSARDNAALAVAAATITNSLLALRAAGLIDESELLRLVYRFAGEVVDVEAVLERARQAPPGAEPGDGQSPGGDGGHPRSVDSRPAGIKIDPVTGEGKGAARIT